MGSQYYSSSSLVYIHHFSPHNFVELKEQQIDHPDLNGFTLLLPGKVINISAVCKAKKFKDRGNKPVAIEACRRLEKGLGTLHELGSSRGTPMVNLCIISNKYINFMIFCNMQKYEFRKIPFPESKKEQADLAVKLAKFGVTLKSHASSLDKDEIIGYDNLLVAPHALSTK